MLKQPQALLSIRVCALEELREVMRRIRHTDKIQWRENFLPTFNDVQGVADLTEVLRDPQHLGKRLRLLSRAGHGHDNVYNTDWFLATQKPESSTGSYTLLLPQCVLIFHKIIFQMKSL